MKHQHTKLIEELKYIFFIQFKMFLYLFTNIIVRINTKIVFQFSVFILLIMYFKYSSSFLIPKNLLQ